MAGFYRFDERAATGFADMCASFTDRRSRDKRIRMAAYCLSQTYSKTDPPFFTAGGRTIAEACGVSYSTARAFLETCEEEGWIVNLGTIRRRRGKYAKRTFFWMVDGSERGRGCAVVTTHPAADSQEVTTRRCVANTPSNDAYQRAELSEGGALPLSALATERQAPNRTMRPPTPDYFTTPIGITKEDCEGDDATW